MNATVFDIKKGVFQISVEELSQRLPADGFFWIDIDGASAKELQSVAAALYLSEPMSSWLPRFGQQARFEVDSMQTRISTWGVTFLTGFFGMNFQWMVAHLDSLRAFLLFGVGSFVAMLVATLALFRSRGWLGEKHSAQRVIGSQRTEAKNSAGGYPPAQSG